MHPDSAQGLCHHVPAHIIVLKGPSVNFLLPARAADLSIELSPISPRGFTSPYCAKLTSETSLPPEAGLHPSQRWPGGPQLAAQHHPARLMVWFICELLYCSSNSLL